MKEEINENLEVIVGALILNDENKILLVRGTKWDGKYVAPGGHVKFGENTAEAIKRELKEELGIDVEIEDMLGFGEAIKSNSAKMFKERHMIFLDYLCRFNGDPQKIKLNEEHDGGFDWFSIDETKKQNLAGETKSFIEKYEKYLKEKNSLDGWKRAQADFENYKKDQGKRMEEFRKFACLDFVLQILPVIDNFQTALEHVPENEKESGWVKGINYILKQLEDVLKNYGVEEIEAKVGDDFNPEVHEAIESDHVKSAEADHVAGAKETDKIKKVVQKGYKMDGKVIRAVRVIVN